MAIHAAGGKQLRAGFVLVEILRSRKPARQHSDDNERNQSATDI
jgi:hypothetical protein